MKTIPLQGLAATPPATSLLKSSHRARRFLRANGYGDEYARAILVNQHVLAELKDGPPEWDLFFTDCYIAEPYDGVTVPADLPPDHLRQYLEAWALPLIARLIEDKAAAAAKEAGETLLPLATSFVQDSSLLEAEQVRVSAVTPHQPGSQLRLSLQLNVSLKLHDGLLAMDKKLVGTRHYLGMAFFWAYEYRHYLRPASTTTCQLVHDALLRAGLLLRGESPQHLAIIEHYTTGQGLS